MQRQQENPYMSAMLKRGIDPRWMAQNLSAQGIGTPEKWMSFFQTGNPRIFDNADKQNAKVYFDNNQHLAHELRNILSAN